MGLFENFEMSFIENNASEKLWNNQSCTEKNTELYYVVCLDGELCSQKTKHWLLVIKHGNITIGEAYRGRYKRDKSSPTIIQSS